MIECADLERLTGRVVDWRMLGWRGKTPEASRALSTERVEGARKWGADACSVKEMSDLSGYVLAVKLEENAERCGTSGDPASE